MARPREFDIDEALDAATEMFWRHGYEATSLADLMDAMGLKKGSVYKAFGSKHELFVHVLERYLEKLFQETRAVVMDAPTPVERVRRFIEFARSTGTENDSHKGCLAVNTVVELAPHDKQVRRILEDHHKSVVAALSEIIRGGQADGSFRRDTPAEDLAVYLTVVAAGFVTASKASLRGIEKPDLGDIVLSTLQP